MLFHTENNANEVGYIWCQLPHTQLLKLYVLEFF